jgi:hypothetical protein
MYEDLLSGLDKVQKINVTNLKKMRKIKLELGL